MKRNITLTSLIINVFAIIITSAILIGSTFAWFTDSVTSTNNKIQAGTLKIDLELLDKEQGWYSLRNEKKAIFDYENWEPGYTDIRILKIENEGSLALKWKAKFVAKKALSALADVIEVYVLPSSNELTYPTERNLENYTFAGTVSDFVNTIESTTTGILLSQQVEHLAIALKMPTELGNEYQGMDLGGSFDITIVATQVNLENDGFNDSYDQNAPYPVVVNSAQSLKDAMLIKNARITLEQDIVVDSSTPLQYGLYMFIANGREVTIDLNGHDIILDETTSTNLAYAFTTANGGTLNIVGNGNIISKNGVTGIFRGMNPSDQINIYGGEFTTNTADNYIMYVNRGRIDVYGGKFYFDENYKCANAEDAQGDRLGIIFHEGVLLQYSAYQKGDASRIQLAENCSLIEVVIDGETWYKVTLNN